MSMVPTLTPTAAKNIEEMLASASVQVAFNFFDSHAEEITEDQIRICSIPAPPFGEKRRAEYLRDRFSEIGLEGAQIDEEGNCLALRRGRSLSPLLVVSAHLDTVFHPERMSLFGAWQTGYWRLASPTMAVVWLRCWQSLALWSWRGLGPKARFCLWAQWAKKVRAICGGAISLR